MHSLRRLNTYGNIIDAASDLFFAEGFGKISIDCIALRAGVAKITVYQHFKSKEAILLECLSRRISNREATLNTRFAEPQPDPAVLLEFFDWLEEVARAGNFRGCAFVKAVNEMFATLPEVQNLAQQAKLLLRERIVRLAASSGLNNPELLGDELAVLLDGAQALSLIEQSPRPFHAARNAAIKLLLHHGWKQSNHPAALTAARHA